eukprot:scaffold226024_cov36-Tisochrysis_lutea.AAC.2
MRLVRVGDGGVVRSVDCEIALKQPADVWIEREEGGFADWLQIAVIAAKNPQPVCIVDAHAWYSGERVMESRPWSCRRLHGPVLLDLHPAPLRDGGRGTKRAEQPGLVVPVAHSSREDRMGHEPAKYAEPLSARRVA